jgi:ketosteroid isomerase-like protein
MTLVRADRLEILAVASTRHAARGDPQFHAQQHARRAGLRRARRIATSGGDRDRGRRRRQRLLRHADQLLARLQQLYFASFPDGIERKALPDITYFRVRPTWLRDSDFSQQPPAIVEHDIALLTDDEATAFARAHVDVWNTHDLDAILDDYTADATLSSPVAKSLTGASTIRGHAALREYFATAFAKYPDLRFDLHHTFRGEHGVTLLFRGAGGRMVAEVLRLDRNRKITRVDAHYAC